MRVRRSLSRCGYSNIPWEQFVEACDFAVGASGACPSELGLEIHDVELGGFDQGIGDGRSFSATPVRIAFEFVPAEPN